MGGGEADPKAIPAQKVEADIGGGGAARIQALQTRVASKRAGDNRQDRGHPDVTSGVRGQQHRARGPSAQTRVPMSEIILEHLAGQVE